MANLGFIGLGVMGGLFAERLPSKGHPATNPGGAFGRPYRQKRESDLCRRKRPGAGDEGGDEPATGRVLALCEGMLLAEKSGIERATAVQALVNVRRRAEPVRGNPPSAGFRHAIEEINGPRLQRILSAYDEESLFPDHLLEDFGSMPQVVRGDTDVGPNSLPHQGIRIVPEFCRQQRFHGWPNAVNDRTQVPRLVFRRLLDFFQGGQNSAAPGMSQNHHQPCAGPRSGELDAADLRGSDDVSRNADDKEVAQALVEDDLRRYPRVGTTENGGKRLLT